VGIASETVLGLVMIVLGLIMILLVGLLI